MKKRLLLSIFAVLSVLGISAHEAGDYVYTSTQRFKVTDANILTNGMFTPATEGWTDQDGAAVSVENWLLTEGEGPNGENVLKSIGGSTEGSLCQALQITPGVTYTVSFWIKGATMDNTTATRVFVNGDGQLAKATNSTETPVVDVLTNCIYSEEWTEVSAVVTVADSIANPYLVINFNQLPADVMVTNFSVNTAEEVYDIRIMKNRLDYAKMLMALDEFNTENAAAEYATLDETIQGMEGAIEFGMMDDFSTAEGALSGFEEVLNQFLDVESDNMASSIKTLDFGSLTGVGRGRNFPSGTIDNLSLWGGNWGHISGEDCLMSAIQTGQKGHTATFVVSNANFPAGKYFFSAEIRNAHTSKSSWPCPGQVFDLETTCKMSIGTDTIEIGPVAGEAYQRFYMIANVAEDGKFTASVMWPGTENNFEDASANDGGAFYIRSVDVRGFGEMLDKAAHFAAWKSFKAQYDAMVGAREKLLSMLGDGNYPWGQDSLQHAKEVWDPYYNAFMAKGWVTANGEDAGVATTDELTDWATTTGYVLADTTETSSDAEKAWYKSYSKYALVRGYQYATNYVTAQNKPFTDLATAIDEAKATRNKGTNATGDRETYKTAILEALATLKQVRTNTTDATREDDVVTLTTALETLNAATEAFLASAEVKPIVDIDFTNRFELVTPEEGSEYYRIAGAAGEMQFVGVADPDNNDATTFGLGYQEEYTDVLRVGNGEATVSIEDPGNLLTVSFDLWGGKLIGKYAWIDLRNEANERVAGFRYSFYDVDVNYNDFNDVIGKNNGGTGMDVRQYALGIGSGSQSNAAICSDNAKNHFDLVIDYNKQTLQGTLINGKNQKSAGAEMPFRADVADSKIVKFVVGSNYNNKDRQCWFDNLKITRFGDAPADFEEDITESPWVEVDAIESVNTTKAASSAIYSITGVRLNSMPQKGLYIQNGKKFVVK